MAQRDAPPDTPTCPVWVPTRKDDTTPTAAARAAALRAAEDEYRRLLYVAMTRAADRLIVCGSVGERGAPAGCWYELIEQGLEASGLLTDGPGDFGDATVRRYRKAGAELDLAFPEPPARQQPTTRPDWLTKNVIAEPVRLDPIRPSGFVDDPPLAALLHPGEERRRALLRGTLVHRLMQSLPDVPPAHRAEAARQFLARQQAGFSETEQGEITRQVMALLSDPRFTALFAPDSRAEVPIVGRIGDRLVNGVVDRLVVAPDAVLIADYKTNRPAPTSLAETLERHPGYVGQLALYRAVLMRLYPGRTIRAALVWTDLPALAEIPAQALDAALKKLTRP